jgi:hypothetical protein
MHSMALMVGVQAAVPHKNMAITTAIFLLITEIGGAIGSAIGTSFTSFFPSSNSFIQPARCGHISCRSALPIISLTYRKKHVQSYLDPLSASVRSHLTIPSGRASSRRMAMS